MSGDVVDFAPVRRTRKWVRPQWQWQTGNAAVPLAVLGAALAAASLFGQWSSLTMPNGAEAPGLTVFGLGPIAPAVVLAMIALVMIVAIALFGESPGGSKNLRVAGLALSGSSLILLGAIAAMLTDTVDEGMIVLDDFLRSQVQPAPTLAWGIYAAFGALIALGAVLLLPATAPRSREVLQDVDGESEFADDAVDLTVTVEPVQGTGR